MYCDSGKKTVTTTFARTTSKYFSQIFITRSTTTSSSPRAKINGTYCSLPCALGAVLRRKLDADALAAKFSQRGCRILMMTEHDRGFSQLRLEEFRRTCAKV